ncbi:MAG TPA: ABC transporter substrate-binding protein [Anaeromyxobacteraceae bacterium]|nr:ABC transporter substrate-binding protein [Anaeromyxobacteraceae bacterium]
MPPRVTRALLAAALAVAGAAACRRAPPPRVERVRLYVAPGLPGAVAAELARGLRVADPVPVARIEEAEVAWLRDPLEAFALGDAAAPGSAPEQPGVPADFLDRRRRFAPVGAVARVIVSSADGGGDAFAPDDLRELADPHARGKVAIPRLDRRDGAMLVAALELAYGERGTLGWLAQLAGNDPIVAEDDADALARVVAGGARWALTDSLAAGQAARGRPLRITFTDQKGKGCVAIPTALVVLPGAGAAARKLSAWLTGPDAEQMLVDRAPGLLPLRAEATASDGLIPLSRLSSLSLDWNALAEGTQVWERRLAGWPPEVRDAPRQQ